MALQNLNPEHPDRLDDYRVDDIRIRRARRTLKWVRHDDSEEEKEWARNRALAILEGQS